MGRGENENGQIPERLQRGHKSTGPPDPLEAGDREEVVKTDQLTVCEL